MVWKLVLAVGVLATISLAKGDPFANGVRCAWLVGVEEQICPTNSTHDESLHVVEKQMHCSDGRAYSLCSEIVNQQVSHCAETQFPHGFRCNEQLVWQQGNTFIGVGKDGYDIAEKGDRVLREVIRTAHMHGNGETLNEARRMKTAQGVIEKYCKSPYSYTNCDPPSRRSKPLAYHSASTRPTPIASGQRSRSKTV